MSSLDAILNQYEKNSQGGSEKKKFVSKVDGKRFMTQEKMGTVQGLEKEVHLMK